MTRLPSAVAFAAVLLVLPPASAAQQVRGVVVQDGTDTPIPGVEVELLAQDSTVLATAVTAATGWFELVAVSDGRFLLRTAHPVYSAGGVLAVTLEKREVITVVLRMGGGAIPLEPLLVTARAHDRLSGFRERSRRGMGTFILRDDIERRVAARPSDVLRMVPGIRIESVRTRGGFSASVVRMRSLGSLCTPAVYLDGMPIMLGFGDDIDDLVATELLEGIEIYSSHVTAPLELHVPRNTCGVIAFWSRTVRGRGVTWKQLGLGALLAGLMLVLSR